MGKWTKRLLIPLAILLVIAGGAYWWLMIQSGTSSQVYALDMGEVRKLAESIPGATVTEIRVENPERADAPAAMVVAGDGWSSIPMSFFSYQLVFPDHTLIIDTTFSKATALKNKQPFDVASYDRLVKGMNAASLIVITHEHVDHLGGLVSQPNLKQLLAHTKLNAEQVANAVKDTPETPVHAFDGYKPTTYAKYLAIAPGVVLIRAAGHTPGSQMVYVKRADGQEFLLLGDVAWHMRNIDLNRERARIVSWLFLNEDRDAVLAELDTLHKLKAAEPNLHMIPGHDPAPVADLEKQGLLKASFQ